MSLNKLGSETPALRWKGNKSFCVWVLLTLHLRLNFAQLDHKQHQKKRRWARPPHPASHLPSRFTFSDREAILKKKSDLEPPADSQPPVSTWQRRHSSPHWLNWGSAGWRRDSAPRLAPARITPPSCSAVAPPAPLTVASETTDVLSMGHTFGDYVRVFTYFWFILCFEGLTQAWTNYGPGSIFIPLKILIRPTKLEEIIWIVSKS